MPSPPSRGNGRRDAPPTRRSLPLPHPLGRGSLVTVAGIVLLGVSTIAGCRRDRDMADRVEMPDTTILMRAMESEPARDSMLDTLPGGEMARGDSAMEMILLKDKMESPTGPEAER